MLLKNILRMGLARQCSVHRRYAQLRATVCCEQLQGVQGPDMNFTVVLQCMQLLSLRTDASERCREGKNMHGQSSLLIRLGIPKPTGRNSQAEPREESLGSSQGLGLISEDNTTEQHVVVSRRRSSRRSQ